ncbi:hypothetical protein GCM10010435_34320 [Winogradskya consettensis]|uniref:Co/Zn/Cd efflux system component n=1 Tax=Winogradskya consettensis TaxID=113560 RepID=A0A919SMH9_9ACTN|nr:hypothetical protein [Actinoplanes consettensis]GIM74316.1 hypothetical protein Aco04nite_39640 [Actinoplanes consettensis]
MKNKPFAIVAVLALVVALGFFVSQSFKGTIKLPLLGPECTVKADGEVTLDSVQMANAATISAVGMRRKMSERAIVVALATALQESKLENLDTGDRDSVGLFQQRPSQGWGTPEQIQDPRYAADKFYTALKKVKGWKKMRVTDAAQKVQRSAYPNAYEKWADESEVLTKALTGRATGAVECTVSGEPALRGAAAAAALTEGLRLDWGLDASQDEGLKVAVKDANTGWRYAHWLVSHAQTTGLERVRFADREWNAPDGKWQPVTGDRRVGNDTVVAEVFR